MVILYQWIIIRLINCFLMNYLGELSVVFKSRTSEVFKNRASHAQRIDQFVRQQAPPAVLSFL